MSTPYYPFHNPTIDDDKWVMGMSGFSSQKDAKRDFEDRFHSYARTPAARKSTRRWAG